MATGDAEGKPSLHKFYTDGEVRARHRGERYCQAMFNHLTEVRPALAELVRGSLADPFYASGPQDIRWKRFVKFIEMHWYDQT